MIHSRALWVWALLVASNFIDGEYLYLFHLDDDIDLFGLPARVVILDMFSFTLV